MTKEGLRKPNYWGSLTQASTCRVGNFRGDEVFAPFSALLPLVHPNDIAFGGWDISSLNLAEAMERAKVGRVWIGGDPKPLMSSLNLAEAMERAKVSTWRECRCRL